MFNCLDSKGGEFNENWVPLLEKEMGQIWRKEKCQEGIDKKI